MMTAEQLEIEQWELKALAWFITAARDGTLKPVDLDTIDFKRSSKGKDQPLFNMSQISIGLECGTVACIGGSIFLHRHNAIGNRKVSFRLLDATREYINNQERLKDLFYPWERLTCYNNNMRDDLDHAADVVERFLNTGKIDWRRMK